MTCSPFDLRDYFLRELSDPQQRQMEAHVKLCQPCREELDRLRVTEAALLCLREEEIPQRIAFVSDKIFEPSPWRRWWSGFWTSSARLGFASAAMLSTAIVVYAVHPVRQTAQTLAETKAPVQTIVQTVSNAEIQSRIDAAVEKALAQVERRQTEKTKYLMADLEGMRQRLIIAASVIDQDDRRSRAALMANSGYGPPRGEEQK